MSRKTSNRRAMLEETCQKYGVDSLYLFGSRAEEIRSWLEQETDSLIPSSSDIDVGIKVKTGERWPIEKKYR